MKELLNRLIALHKSGEKMQETALLKTNEPDNLLREIVVHPDGHISGSWYRSRKVICSAE